MKEEIRTKEQVVKNLYSTNSRETERAIFLEVLCDIRDVLIRLEKKQAEPLTPKD